MEILEVTQKPVDGKVVIDLPETMREKELKVIVVLQDEDYENWANYPPEKKLEILKRFTGSAKYPNVETSKYEVYDQ